MTKPIIEVDNLGKCYQIGTERESYLSLRDQIAGRFRRNAAGTGRKTKDFWALKDINFSMQPGETLGIIGNNGAGKSTLLKVLSRITPPTEGRITLRGRIASLLEVGTGFHPELTGRENVYLNGAILGMTRAQVKSRFDDIVAFAEVEQFLETPVKRYSSGMYVRLAFAVAAHLDPEILVVDEVLAVGDVQFQKKCLDKMGDVAHGGRTVLFVSHNLTAIKSLCSRAVVIRSGRLVMDASASEAVRWYTEELREDVNERIWTDEKTALETDQVIFRRVRICNDNGVTIDDVNTDTPFNIEIEYRVKEAATSVGFSIMVHNQENQVVFSSVSNHEPHWYGKAMPAGVYTTRCSIPACLLNSGWFRIGIGTFGKGYLNGHIEYDVLVFEVGDGSIVRGDYFGKYGGWFRPALQWSTTALAPAE